MKIAVIGGGAAGFFAALAAKENYPKAQVHILEKTNKLLSKVKISGGGRCNVTNGTDSIADLARAYPRGGKKLKKSFQSFNNQHVIQWFERRRVPLVTQDDHCVFPRSQNSQSIIDCFISEAKRLNITIELKSPVLEICTKNKGLELVIGTKEKQRRYYNKVIVATGGSPKRAGLNWLAELGHKIMDPVPSLFTFNMPNESIRSLMGIVVEQATVSIQSTKLKSTGPLLITHWGMSGPAILKLSAFGARMLNDMNYKCRAQVNWINDQNFDQAVTKLNAIIEANPKKKLSNVRPYYLPERLWHFLLEKSSIDTDKTWSEIGKKGTNKLATLLTNDIYEVEGKTTFKEEFVTAGGVSLESIDFNTMQSRVVENLYFAGEVMDIDGITGGYNFQAAWTTAWIAGKLN